MKKILFVVDERKLGGVSILLEDLLNNINRNNLDITLLILHDNGDRLHNLPEDINVITFKSEFDVIDIDLKALLKTGRFLKAIKKIKFAMLMKNGSIEKYLKRKRAELGINAFDVEIAFKAGFCTLFVAASDAEKKINWVHEDYSTHNRTKRYEKTFKRILNNFNTHVVVSEAAAESFNKIYNQKDKTVVMENYINTQKIYDLASNPCNVGIDKNKTNIVALGRFANEKGFDRLIEAISILKKEVDFSNYFVYIIGYGELEDKLNMQIAALNLEDNIRIMRSSDLDYNPYSFMKKCDAYIMSSRSESFGLVRVEALLLGLPIITTDVANTYKMIENNTTGIIVENSTEGIIEGLKKVVKDKELLIKLRKNVSDYSYDNNNQIILNQIQKLLEE